MAWEKIMVKKNIKVKQPQRVKNARNNVRMGAVSTIDTAPVAIGNTIRGSKPVVTNSADGARIVGRDFCFECKSTVAAATNWSLVGGFPITPAVLVTGTLRSYTQLFAKFKINRLAFHYITSSPTTQAGDIMFYYEHDRNGPLIDFTNNSFLPFVLSDPQTVIGPQWKNHSMMVKPVSDWNSTNYGITTDLNEESSGSMFLFSKTASANSPGYILVDFDITFKEMCVNPRAGILPVSRGLWNYVTIGQTTITNTAAAVVSVPIAGKNPDGATTAAPSGIVVGDIYKVVALVTNSTVSGVNAAWTNVTTANLISYSVAGAVSTVTIDDGFTFYAVANTATNFILYPDLEAAKTNGATLIWGVGAVSVTWFLCTMVSLVGSINSNLQSSY